MPNNMDPFVDVLEKALAKKDKKIEQLEKAVQLSLDALDEIASLLESNAWISAARETAIDEAKAVRKIITA
jgi:flagellar biosynthesis chaperone FliJ